MAVEIIETGGREQLSPSHVKLNISISSIEIPSLFIQANEQLSFYCSMLFPFGE
jgi:hypothetical protein